MGCKHTGWQQARSRHAARQQLSSSQSLLPDSIQAASSQQRTQPASSEWVASQQLDDGQKKAARQPRRFAALKGDYTASRSKKQCEVKSMHI